MSNSDPVSSAASGPVKGDIIPTFFRFVIPSTLSLLAISTASIVDGFFVGNYIGAEALASVNLLVPYFALLFGFALMMAVGGAVKAGTDLGKLAFSKASEIFSQTFFCVLLVNIIVAPIAMLFDTSLFGFLGGSEALFPMMQDYFYIMCFSVIIQLSGLVIYYFVRADDHPGLGMQALLVGACSNVALDALFIGVFDWGIKGAGFATLLAQIIQLFYLSRYFLKKEGRYEDDAKFHTERRLRLYVPNKNWGALWRSAYNGFSEFVNEISVGIVILVIHIIIHRQSGVDGIAAFSVVNYIIFISLMTYYGIVDAMHSLLSPNFGAGLTARVASFMRLAFVSIAVLTIGIVLSLFLFQEGVISVFLDTEAEGARFLSQQFINCIWPLFLFNGFNVLICTYLTSAQKATQSSIIALSRSLVLPLVFAVCLDFLYSDYRFIYAFPLAEGVTFVVALLFFSFSRPRLFAEEAPV